MKWKNLLGEPANALLGALATVLIGALVNAWALTRIDPFLLT